MQATLLVATGPQRKIFLHDGTTSGTPPCQPFPKTGGIDVRLVTVTGGIVYSHRSPVAVHGWRSHPPG